MEKNEGFIGIQNTIEYRELSDISMAWTQRHCIAT